MIRRSIRVVLILSFICSSTLTWADSLWHVINERLTISGSKSYTFQSVSVEGNRDMFYDGNYNYSPQYRNETNLSIAGKLLTGMSVSASVTNNRWNPNDRIFTLNYDRNRTRASLGDITCSLTGNELLSFSRRLKGATVTQDLGFSKVTAIVSKTKASTKTVTVQGNNTPGPYYLGISQIVDGSERVKIDKDDIPRSDSSGYPNYTLDTFGGIITFRDGLIVSSSSEISVSVETQSINSAAGTIYGVRSDIPVGKRTGFGVTYLMQAAGDTSENTREIAEPFHGNNTLSLPYELLYVPTPPDPAKGIAFTVKVDGIEQIMGLDYTLNYPLHYIVFMRPIPSNSTILVTYTPVVEKGVSSDRSVIGLDAKYKLSNAVTLTGNFARSTKDYKGDDGGSAASLRAAGRFGKLKLSAGVRDIDSSYAPIESAGFFRNERGSDLDLQYQLTNSFTWSSRLDHYTRPYYQYGLGGVLQDDGRTADSSASTHTLEWKPAKLPAMRLTRSQSNTTSGTDSNLLDTDALSINWNSSKLAVTGELSRSNRENTYTSKVDGTVKHTLNSADTSRLSVRYTPRQKYSLMADIANSSIENSGESKTDARNYQLIANYIPTRELNLGFTYRLSDSGSNYTTPYGDSFGGGLGPGSGYPVGGYVPSYGLRSVTRMASLNWNPSTRFAFNSSLSLSSAEGDNSTNTTIKGTDIGFSYTPQEHITIRAYSSDQDGSFVGSDGNMSSRIGFLSATVGPINRFTLDLGYQKMLSETLFSSDFPLFPQQNSITNMRSISGVLRREISGGRFLFSEFASTSVDSYSKNKKTSLAFGIEYPLNEILGLKVDWRIIDYRDDSSSSNSYRANMLNARIGARFR